MTNFSLIDDGELHELTAGLTDECVTLAPAELERCLGWQLKPEGLCRAGSCVPVGDAGDRINADGIDLATFAALIDRPLALDTKAAAAALGTSARQRGAQLASLEAPDFSLPDLEGKLHSLSEHRGKKVLLVAYASW